MVFSLSFHRKNEHAEKNINVPYNKMSVNLLGRVSFYFFSIIQRETLTHFLHLNQEDEI